MHALCCKFQFNTNWSRAGRDYQRLETAPLALLHPAIGTVCRRASPQRKHCRLLRNILKLNCLTNHNYSSVCIFLYCIYRLCNLSLKFAHGSSLNLSFVIIIMMMTMMLGIYNFFQKPVLLIEF